MVFYAAFNSISVISRRQLTLFMSFLGFTSTRQGSEVSCPRTLPRKSHQDPVRLEPRTPGLQVKHFTTGPRGTLSSLNNFFCALHALVHIASSASTALKHTEDGIFENSVPTFDHSFKKLGESGTVRLLRTVSKAFSCGGDEKCEVYRSFNVYIKDFLKSKKLHCYPIKCYHGNRFNILFESVYAVFLMIDKIKNFVEVENSNRSLKSINHDNHVPEFLAGVKAPGLISCLITRLSWSFIEIKAFVSLLTYLRRCIEYLSSFTEGKFILPNVCVETLSVDPF